MGRRGAGRRPAMPAFASIGACFGAANATGAPGLSAAWCRATALLGRLSDELAAWMGTPTASRPEITKHMWAYVKERGLQVRRLCAVHSAAVLQRAAGCGAPCPAARCASGGALPVPPSCLGSCRQAALSVLCCSSTYCLCAAPQQTAGPEQQELHSGG